MYENPRHLRDKEVKAQFDADTYALIKALAAYNKTQPAVLIRELTLQGIERLMKQGTEKAVA